MRTIIGSVSLVVAAGVFIALAGDNNITSYRGIIAALGMLLFADGAGLITDVTNEDR